LSFRFPNASPGLGEAPIFDSGDGSAAMSVPVFVFHGTPLDSGFTQNTQTVDLDPELRWTGWNMRFHWAHRLLAAAVFCKLPALKRELSKGQTRCMLWIHCRRPARHSSLPRPGCHLLHTQI
jgi:hypothetical protein